MKYLLAAALCCAVASPAFADRPLADPAHWLERMAEASRVVSYHGEIVQLHGGKSKSMEITLRNDDDGTIERLLMLDGPPREVIRDGHSVTCIVPDGRESLSGQYVPRNPFPGSEWRYDESLRDHYEFLDLDRDRVAGRQCRVIGIKPRDGMRYGYRLWIDEETGLLLKSDLVDERGRVVEQVAFTRITIPAEIDAAMVTATLEGENLHWKVGRDAPDAENVPWRVQQAPDGFAPRHAPRQRERGVVQQVFTDGLATVSVFVEPYEPARETLQGTSRMGAVSAFGTVIDGWQVTVVGEVPPDTVQLIGESLEFGIRER